jgi:outer membrane autotransporter protein
VLNGDIGFETPGSEANSGQSIDAEVNIHLVGEGSSWTGNIYKEYPGTWDETAVSNYAGVTGFTLELADGAVWNVTETGTDASNTNIHNGSSAKLERQALNNLEFNGGVINLQASTSQTLNIENLSGTGGTVKVKAEKNSDGTFQSGKVYMNSVADGSSPTITETYDGVTSDDLGSDQSSALDQLRAVYVGTEDEPSVKGLTQTVPEGELIGEVTRTTNADGTVGIIEQNNTKQEAFREMVSGAAVAWRHETNDLTKRMGELRDSPEGIGSWVRLYGASYDYGDQDQTVRGNSVQVGVDTDVAKGWKVGAAFSYTDSEMTYDAGSADGDTYAFAVYGTWLGENGQFVDLIGKYARMSNDFNLNGFSGDYDNNALSLSAEFGWRFPLAKQGFIEPQAELTYGRIFGDDFDSAKGTHIDQDDFDSLIGRIGVRAGLKFAEDRGTVYARVSGLYDFLGDYDYTAKTSKLSRSYTEELGGGWVEYAVGGNFRFTDQSYGYIDLERTSGGEVDEDWRWNVGFRYVW